jgi:cytoskeletal protein RodZ
MKVVFLLQRPRHRRSSPSVRQIALVVVSGGLAILVIRVASQRFKSRAGGAEVQTHDAAEQTQSAAEPTQEPAERTQEPAERTQEPAERTQEPAEQTQDPAAQTQDRAEQTEGAAEQTQDDAEQPQGAAGDGAATGPTTGNDTVSESSLTDTVQSELSRRPDAPTPATGTD